MLSDIFFKQSDELRPKSVIDELFGDSGGIDILFLSGEHDLREVMYELDARGLHHVIGCTTAGHISSEGYKTQGGLRFHLGGPRLKSRSWKLDLDLSDLLSKGSELRQFAAANPDAFGIIMIDGLSGREESIVGALRRELPGVPIVGGSAGDSLKFEKTHLFHGAELHSDVAILTLVATADFRVSMFRLQHHSGSGFCTYGEQLDGIHVNQTLVGLRFEEP